MGKLDLSHDDKDCQFLRTIRNGVKYTSQSQNFQTDSSSDEEGVPEPLSAPPPALPPALPPLLDRPRRVTRPPARYSPTPRERRRRQSLARFSPKSRGPDETRVVPMISFKGHRWGPRVDMSMQPEVLDVSESGDESEEDAYRPDPDSDSE